MNRRTWMAAALAAVVGGAPVLGQTGTGKPLPAAVVNGVPISMAELRAVIDLAGPDAVVPTQSQRRQRYVETLGLLIDNILMRQYLEKHTDAIAPAEIAKRIAEMEAGLKAQGKTLAEFCRDTNQTEAQLRASIPDHLRWTAYVAKHVPDTVAEKYFTDNRDFFDRVTIEASHIVLRVLANAPAGERSEARRKLAGWRQQMVSDKADFAALAKKYSQDARAGDGGSLGVLSRKWGFDDTDARSTHGVVFDERFLKAAFALKVGEISDVVETDFGYHLIKVTKRTPGTPADFAKIKEVVREFCAEELRQQILAKERKSAKIEVNLP